MTDIAACLLAFERPHYLRETVKSLENLEEKDTVDWYIFQDGAYNPHTDRMLAKERDVEISHRILERADLPNKTIHVNVENRGIPNQYYRMFQLLDEYDAIIGFEDDIVVSKYGLILKKRLMESFRECIPTLYTNRSIGGMDNIEPKLEVMVKNYTGSSYHTFGIWDYMYRDIKDRYEDYIEIVGDIDYETRPHDKIKNEFNSEVSSNDAVMQRLFAENGYFRLMPYISRAMYIGMEGQHSNPKNFTRDFEGNLGKLEYERDRTLSLFTVEIREEVIDWWEKT